MRRARSSVALTLAWLASCDRARPPAVAPPHPDVTAEPPAACLGPGGGALRFRSYDLAPVGLTFEIIEAADFWGRAVPDPGLIESEPPTASSGWVAQPLSYSTLAVRYGPSATLETWRRELEAYDGSRHALDRRRSIEVCGRPAELVEVRDGGSVERFRREELTWTPDGGAVSRTAFVPEPPRVHVAAAFEHRGLPVLAMWTAPAGSEQAYRCVERRFRASIRCR